MAFAADGGTVLALVQKDTLRVAGGHIHDIFDAVFFYLEAQRCLRATQVQGGILHVLVQALQINGAAGFFQQSPEATGHGSIAHGNE